MDAADPTPRVDTAAAGGRLLLGDWTAAQFGRPGVLNAAAAALRSTPPGQAGWDLTRATRLDHVGAQLLWQHWAGRWPPSLTVTPAQRAVLERVARFGGPAPTGARRRWIDGFENLGRAVLLGLDHLIGFVRLLGQLVMDLGRLLRAPREGPWRDVSGHLYRIGATALPITALVGFLIGVVLAYLTSLQLRQFGADTFIVNILGLGMIRELGPMLAAILIAGRSGSAITAQIGVMRVTEELDAMRVLGIAQGFRLVLPRVLALAVAMPLLSLWTTLAGLAGGMLSADISMGITPAYFASALPRAVDVANLWLASGKAMVFGVLIALIGCHFGLRVQPNTQSLGEGTTASVVTSITVVILVDAVFAVLFKDVGL